MSWPPLARLVLVVVLASVGCTGACGSSEPELPLVQARDGRTYRFLDKGLYKAYYDRDSLRLQWIEYDKNGDGRPEQVDHHDGDARPRWTEVDADSDGRAERWEYFDPSGRPTRVATGRQGRPEEWIFLDPAGVLQRREYDRNGDAKPERIERFESGRLVAVELDGDGDGRVDRWQAWARGAMAHEDVDTDGDGRPDRRLTFGPRGEVASIAPFNR